MKTSLLFALLATVALSVSAQSNTYSEYLNKALSSSEKGDCETARKYYNVYKELSGKTSPSVEVLIQDCEPVSKHYAINDKITMDGYIYRVAYTEDNGTHGFAIYELGSGPLTDDLIKNRKVPTLSEMILIARNAERLNLVTTLYYWTLDKYNSDNNYVYRFSTNSKDWNPKSYSYGRILIYRF